MNDPRFQLPSTVNEKFDLSNGSSEGSDSHSSDFDESVKIPCSAIQPLLESITARDILINEELIVNYNRGKINC